LRIKNNFPPLSGARYLRKYEGLDIEVLAKRKVLYQQKRNEHPERWSKSKRNWQPIGAVELNPQQYKEAA
jgi:putative transposase